MAYAELHCLSNFSFQRGASHPRELIARAQSLGYTALALTDECSMAGMVRAHEAALHFNFKLIVGTEICLQDGPRLVLLAQDQAAYSEICGLIAQGRRAAPKGKYLLLRADVERLIARALALWLPDNEADGDWVAQQLRGRVHIAAELHGAADEAAQLERLRALAARFGLPVAASGDVHMHVRERRALQDVQTAIRLGQPLRDCGHALFPNGERHLRTMAELQARYPQDWLSASAALAAQCQFRLDELRYQYPHELVPAGETAASWLRRLSETGAAKRWPQGVPEDTRAQIDAELALIAELGYEHFFLTVHDIVAFARGHGILCQGRGSAANSAVCYALGITAVDPARSKTLFARFLSRERKEPPDIDVDFEHQRREEVIQYIYRKYGRTRAALAATVVTYGVRSALRDVGRALGLAPDVIDRFAKTMAWWDDSEAMPERMQELGLDAEMLPLQLWMQLVRELEGFPRHLSQHVGGFVISEAPLSQLVPVENAAMPERTIIQWDKDDLEALGLLKVDVLALGMLSAIRRALALVSDYEQRPFAITDVPAEDSQTYAMIQRAETIGVFQIESRAQMSMLPRLKPACFYDLVVQVAIVRPGPIQGGMVHPYLKARANPDAVAYPSEALKGVLARTLGVPLFQEQVIEIAIVAADFTPGEADQVRRSMAAWKRSGGMEPIRERLFAGMARNGYTPEFSERIFEMIKGFGDYGFPESHSASFALLAYVSAWLKCHRPAAFTAALLNSQPMGFYQPSQLVQEARRNGVRVHPIDVTRSDWDCTLARGPSPELRLGLCLVRGLSEIGAQQLLAARADADFVDLDDLIRRARLSARDRRALADADALAALAGHRHAARWAMLGVEDLPGMLRGVSAAEPPLSLRAPEEAENIFDDYAASGLSLRRHPVALLRPRLDSLRVRRAEELRQIPNGTRLRVAGLVINRQRPGTAKGTMFMTLEDETGSHNLIIWPAVLEVQRRAIIGSRFVIVSGELQNANGVVHVVATRFHDRSHWIGALRQASRDFH